MLFMYNQGIGPVIRLWGPKVGKKQIIDCPDYCLSQIRHIIALGMRLLKSGNPDSFETVAHFVFLAYHPLTGRPP